MNLAAWLSESISSQEQKLRNLASRHSHCIAGIANAEGFLRSHTICLKKAEANLTSLEETRSRHRAMVERAKGLGYSLSDSKEPLNSLEQSQEAWLDEAVGRANHKLQALIRENPPYEADIARLRSDATGIQSEIEAAESTLRSLVALKAQLADMQTELNGHGFLSSIEAKAPGEHDKDESLVNDQQDIYQAILNELRKKKAGRDAANCGSDWRTIPEWTR